MTTIFFLVFASTAGIQVQQYGTAKAVCEMKQQADLGWAIPIRGESEVWVQTIENGKRACPQPTWTGTIHLSGTEWAQPAPCVEEPPRVVGFKRVKCVLEKQEPVWRVE